MGECWLNEDCVRELASHDPAGWWVRPHSGDCVFKAETPFEAALDYTLDEVRQVLDQSIRDIVAVSKVPSLTQVDGRITPKPDAWADERADVLARFTEELSKATGDGSKKRKAGEKPPWYIDTSHEGAIFSHLTKWKRGETIDPDSGAHPLVHLAWRALAIALQETGNVPEGAEPS